MGPTAHARIALLLESWHRWVISEAEYTAETVDVLTWLCPQDVRDLVLTAERMIADLERRIASTLFAAAAENADEDGFRYWRSQALGALEHRQSYVRDMEMRCALNAVAWSLVASG
jgi:hypothetical protein